MDSASWYSLALESRLQPAPTPNCTTTRFRIGKALMGPARTILHPTDFSASAEEAFRVAVALAASLKARLVVLHVFPRHGPMVAYGAASIQFRSQDERDRRLPGLRALQAPDPGARVRRRLVEA